MSKQQELPNMPPVFQTIKHLDEDDAILFEAVLRDMVRQGFQVHFRRDEAGVACTLGSGRPGEVTGTGEDVLSALYSAKAKFAKAALYGEEK